MKNLRKENRINKIGLSAILALGLFVYPSFIFAEGLDPYSFDKSRELQPVLQESFLPPVLRANQNQRQALPNSAPQQPALVTDGDGNKFIYQNGQLLLKIDPQGSQTFYVNGLSSHEKDDEGRLTRTYEHSGARTTIKNEFGEVIGYQESGLGGLLLRGYDEKGRLTQKYEYEGRRVKVMVDTLTNSRTLYNERGKPDREINFEGTTTMTYYYRDDGRLGHKVGILGNKTTYDDMGREQFSYDKDGNITETYAWESMNRYKVIDIYGNATYFDHGRAQYEKNYTGSIIKTYNWQGTKLISHTDISTEEVTYYENGRPIETKYYGDGSFIRVGLWKYDEETGILVSKTYGYGKTTYYDHGREGLTTVDENFDLTSFSSDYKPIFYDEIIKLVRQYKDTSVNITPLIQEIINNNMAASQAKEKGDEAVDEVPSDNDDNGRHVGPPETPPAAPPAVGDDENPGRRVGPP